MAYENNKNSDNINPQVRVGGDKRFATRSGNVEDCLNMLRCRDDTSRFMGLAMLLSLTNYVNRTEIMQRCSEVLDCRFLDRLLKTDEVRRSHEEASAMRELAINITYAFASCIHDAGENNFIIGRSSKLIEVIPHSSSGMTLIILKTLLIISMGSNGSRRILETHDLTPIIDALPHHAESILILRNLFIRPNQEGSTTLKKLETVLSSLCEQLKGCKRDSCLSILSFLAEIVPRVSKKGFNQGVEWVNLIYTSIKELMMEGPSLEERKTCTILSAQLLQLTSPILLFAPDDVEKQPLGKSFSYIFIQLVTIDIQATFPLLIEQRGSLLYHDTAQRQAAGFEIIVAYLTFLSDAMDLNTIGLQPELLLKIRNNISETFILSLEFLRDLYDLCIVDRPASDIVKGPAIGLSTTLKLPRDYLVASIVRALSLWLQEDESLQKEATCIIDLLLVLWQDKESQVDFRPWIIAALDGITEQIVGREEFVAQMGWEILWNDLKSIYENVNQASENDIQLAIEGGRLLAGVVRAQKISNKKWTEDVVKTIRFKNVETKKRDQLQLEATICNLAVSCLVMVRLVSNQAMSEQLQKLQAVIEGLETLFHNGVEGIDDWMKVGLYEAAKELGLQ